MQKKGLASRILTMFRGSAVDEDVFEELEDVLIAGDVGVNAAMEAVDELRRLAKEDRAGSRDEVLGILKSVLGKNVRGTSIEIKADELNFVLVLGVNGVGKTTALARLAHRFKQHVEPDRIVLGAGDTFRAAAVDQLKIHGERLGLRVVSQPPGADPGAVIYDTIESAFAHDGRIVLADTAGRMHNKANLVRELSKIDGIIKRRVKGGTYHKLLVIDATTGQNGLRQAEVFHEAVGVDSIFMAKYDSTAKGGIAVAIGRELGIPVSFLGTGEKMGDIEPFEPAAYLESLLEG